MPGYGGIRRQLCEDAADEPRAARQSRTLGHFAIACDLAARNAPHGIQDLLLRLSLVHDALY